MIDRVQELIEQLGKKETECLATIELSRRAAERALELKKELDFNKSQQEITLQARDLLNSVSETMFEQSLKAIETLVTEGLQKVLRDSSLQLSLTKVIRRNRVEVDVTICSTYGTSYVETDVLSARGGGLAAVVGFMVRLVLLIASGNRKFLILDETFAHLSEEFEPLMAEMLADLSDRLGVQILMVTHSDAYIESADRVYHVSIRDGETYVRQK